MLVGKFGPGQIGLEAFREYEHRYRFNLVPTQRQQEAKWLKKDIAQVLRCFAAVRVIPPTELVPLAPAPDANASSESPPLQPTLPPQQLLEPDTKAGIGYATTVKFESQEKMFQWCAGNAIHAARWNHVVTDMLKTQLRRDAYTRRTRLQKFIGPCLEIMAGYGRMYKELKPFFDQYHAVDVSADMLKIFKENHQRMVSAKRLMLVEKEVQKIDWQNQPTYSLVFGFAAMAYMTTEQNRAYLLGAKSKLRQ